MNRTDDNAPIATRNNLLLSAIASLLIFAGLIGLAAPQLYQALPEDIASELTQNALLLLVTGLAIEAYLIYRLVRRVRVRAAQAGRALAAQAAPALADTVAPRVDWSPVKHGGANFRTKRLVARGPGRFEVRVTWQSIAFCALFIAVGLGVGGGALVAGGGSSSLEALVPLCFGALFAGIGAVMLYFFSRPAVFDRQLGWYWRGNPTLRAPGEIRRLGDATELANVQALQVLTERVSGKSSYNSYELNLVLKDGKRINVMDHGHESTLRADAQSLAQLLGVPVWTRSST
jgi:hypothetical protein